MVFLWFSYSHLPRCMILHCSEIKTDSSFNDLLDFVVVKQNLLGAGIGNYLVGCLDAKEQSTRDVVDTIVDWLS